MHYGRTDDRAANGCRTTDPGARAPGGQRGVVRTGDYLGLLDPGLERFGDPKNFIPPVGPESLSNPLTWVFGLSRAVALFITELALLMVLFGLNQLLRPEVRAHRRGYARLVAGTILSAALVAFSFTWYGMRLQTWLLD